jgi:hypothetical protein
MTLPNQFPSGQPPQQQAQAAQEIQQAVAAIQQQQPQVLQCTDPDLHYPGQEAPTTGMSVLLFGPIGTWKTTFAAMWPSPVFLSCGTEGGDDALGQVTSIWPGVPVPPTYRIASRNMMVEKIEFIIRNARQFGWKTIVVDSLTYYIDLWIKDLMIMRNEVIEEQNKNLSAKDRFQLAMEIQDWGMLEHHIMKELVPRLHSSGLNVIWTALVKDKKDKKGNTLGIIPDCAGATERKIPGVCKLILFAEPAFAMVEQLDPITGVKAMKPKMIPKYWTTPPSPMVQGVRHRYGPSVFPYGFLVDPQYGVVPTYEAVRSQIGQYIVQ